jgi:multicomponent Na+:H+ antiporter subunit A
VFCERLWHSPSSAAERVIDQMPLILTLLVLAAAVVVSGPLSRLWDRRAGFALALLYLAATAVFWPVVPAVLAGATSTWSVPWLPAVDVALSLRADGLGVVFTLIALVIGAIVLAYAAVYLPRHGSVSFHLLMAAFTLSMVGLVLADDLLVFFVCWELTSMASFFLIGRAGRPGESASLRTMLLTFVGGLFLLVAIGLIMLRTQTTSLSQALVDPVWTSDPAYAAVVAVLVALAGFSKAAQFPFHVWLPDAMAAPTPVSAYLHAAAVVKAGIFLLLRFSPAFHHVPAWNVLLVTVGLLTGFLGARYALAQTDLKRLMAYSTVSQLGLITATIGVGTTAAIAAAVLHTIAHALFKSGLFMMVGIIDHATGTRDLRRLPPLLRVMPVSFTLTLIGVAAMAGIIPLLGFVSKEGLLHGLLHTGGPAWTGWLALTGGTAVSVLTFAYCGRILIGGFVDGTDDREAKPGEPGLLWSAAIPLLAGVVLGPLVAWLDLPVAAAVRAALPGTTAEVHFGLWHGVTPELIATVVIIVLGVVLVLNRFRLRRRFEHILPIDGPTVITALNERAAALGRLVVRPVTGELPVRHLSPIVAAMAGLLLIGLGLVLAGGPLPPTQQGLIRPIDVVVLVLITTAVLGVCLSTSRLAATVSLSAVGILATVQILALGAPDVGLTQLLVESLTVLVIMLVLQRLPHRFAPALRRRQARAIVLAVLTGLAAGGATFVFSGRRERSPVAEYLIHEGPEVAGAYNIVNVILVEFRALDTLGELSVLGMAGVVLVAVLSTVRDELLDPPLGQDPAQSTERTPVLRPPDSAAYRAVQHAWANVIPLKLMVRVLNPVLAVLSAMIFLRGHNEPGGGFIAALVGSCAVALTYLSTSRDRQVGPPRLPLFLIGGGVLVALGSGEWGLAVHGSFLEPVRGALAGIHLSSSMVFDAGVYAAVLGLILITFNLLGTSPGTGRDPRGERTRERTDEAVEGELTGPLDTVRGERPGPGSRFVTNGRPPREQP